MEILKGSIAKSSAGHDKGVFFVCTKIDGDYAYITDGKYRPLERQKRKKLKHLKPTSKIVSVEELTTNNQVKKLLSQWNTKTIKPNNTVNNHLEE